MIFYTLYALEKHIGMTNIKKKLTGIVLHFHYGPLTVKYKTINMCFPDIMFPNKKFTIPLTEFSVNTFTLKK